MMRKKLLITLILVFSIITTIFIFQIYETSDKSKQESEKVQNPKIDVVMPTKVSRPGCEETDSCYIPSTIRKKLGDSVTWLNEDAAFHSVTSGTYGNPDLLFDSGHIDPNDSFTFNFKNEGIYNYYCTLHPWMNGIVIVES